MWADINGVQRCCHPQSNPSKAEARAIRELKGDRDRLVLTPDKGVAMVVMDRQDYINKSNNLSAQPAYRPIPQDPTNKIKAKLITLLKKVKRQTGLDGNTYKAMCPMGCSAPKFYGLPKIHKPGTPLRSTLSNHGSVTYEVAEVLTKILKPLVGKSPHHVHSTQDFVEQTNKVILMPGECLSSYDVTALFTSVPVDPALGIIKDHLGKDSTLKERTVLPVKDIILLLEFCLKNTFLSRVSTMNR